MILITLIFFAFYALKPLTRVKAKLLTIISSPIVMALLLSAVTIYFLPNFFSKYQMIQEKTEYYGYDDYLYMEDLDGDSISERVIIRNNSQVKASYLIHNADDAVIDQFNFDASHHNLNPVIGFLDVDNNGYKEIYNLTYVGDSVFLNIIEPLLPNGIDRRNIFVDSLPKYKGEDLSKNNELRTGGYFLQKVKGGTSRVAFDCSTGFLQYPRNVFAYDFDKDSILKSTHLVNPVLINQVIDLDGDGSDEILTAASSADNTIDSVFTTRSDSKSWLNVLDDDLSFMFPPVEFPVVGSATLGFVIEKDNEKRILGYLQPRYSKETQTLYKVYDNKGSELEEVKIGKHRSYVFFDGIDKFRLYDRKTGISRVLNVSSARIEQEKNLQIGIVPRMLDLDNDGTQEFTGLSIPNKTFTVFEEGFGDSLVIDLPNRFDKNPYRLGTYNDSNSNYKIWIQNRNELYTYDYGENPMYLLKYPIYLGIYIALYLLVWGIMKLQSLQEEKKRKIETQIAELQMKTIKSQLDPHFVFNAMNTISEMTLADNKMEADRYITSFSSLMRKTLKGSDKIAHSLQDELDYIKNYIELQRLRLQNHFDYDIVVEKDMDTSVLVPKHVLYTYVENAIKHGLALRQEKGMLKVGAKNQGRGIQLTVTDNGDGMGRSRVAKGKSTGSGLRIMEHLFQLYQERFKKKIALEFVENDTDTPSGLIVIVTIT